MKLNFKKIYKSTIRTLEAHQIELSIALTAISLLAFAPDPELDDVRVLLTDMQRINNEQIAALKLRLGDSE